MRFNRLLWVWLQALVLCVLFAVAGCDQEQEPSPATPDAGVVVLADAAASADGGAVIPDAMAPDAMVNDAMVNDGMVNDAMTDDAMTDDAMTDDAMTTDAMVNDAMVEDAAPATATQ